MTATMMKYQGLGLPSERRQELPAPDSEMQELLHRYCTLHDEERRLNFDETVRKAHQLFNVRMTQERISLFLEYTQKYRNSEFYGLKTGICLSALVQCALNDHPEISLTIPPKIERVCYGLKPERKKQLNVTLNGDVGQYCLQNAGTASLPKYLSAIIRGNCENNLGCGSSEIQVCVEGDCGALTGERAWRSFFEIKGSTGHSLGYLSNGSVFDIAGALDEGCGENSISSCYILRGNIGRQVGRNAVGCTFKTTPENYDLLRRMVPDGNKVQVITESFEW